VKAIIIELRAGEGGDDAKSLVQEFTTMYAKAAGRREL
jgi:protein subunit release factor A